MARLIDVEKVCTEIDRFKGYFLDEDMTYRLKMEVRRLPTVDAEPVRHGHYIGEADGYADGELVHDIWSCSECGCYFEDWNEKPTYNFCPNCGAKMDGEGRENATDRR